MRFFLNRDGTGMRALLTPLSFRSPQTQSSSHGDVLAPAITVCTGEAPYRRSTVEGSCRYMLLS